MKTSLILTLFLAFGCARLSYSPKFKVENKKEKQVLEILADKMTWDQAKDVKVYEKPPKGIKITKGRVKLYGRKYRYLGKVYTEFNRPGLFTFYKYPEDMGWRNSYCHFQQILTWLTLGVWFISPTYWPCYVKDSSNERSDVKARRLRMVKTMQKMTKALGGNILVVTNIGKLKSKLTDEQVLSISAEGHAFELIGRK